MQVNEVKFYVWRDESIIGEHNSGFLSGDICNQEIVSSGFNVL